MMRYLGAFILIVLVLASAGCVKTGGGGEVPTSSSTTSVETASTTTTSSLTTSSVTTSVETTASTTLKPETTYTTIFRGTCFDGVMNQGESGVDCGGNCKPCEIKCSSDGDCGSPHYSKQYCKGNAGNWSIMRDYVTYRCKDAGEWNSSCALVKKSEQLEKCRYDKQCLFTDFCPGETYTRCEEARCILTDEVCDWIVC